MVVKTAGGTGASKLERGRVEVSLGCIGRRYRHEDELTLIFDKISVFQEGFFQNIRTMT